MINVRPFGRTIRSTGSRQNASSKRRSGEAEYDLDMNEKSYRDRLTHGRNEDSARCAVPQLHSGGAERFGSRRAARALRRLKRFHECVVEFEDIGEVLSAI